MSVLTSQILRIRNKFKSEVGTVRKGGKDSVGIICVCSSLCRWLTTFYNCMAVFRQLVTNFLRKHGRITEGALEGSSSKNLGEINRNVSTEY